MKGLLLRLSALDADAATAVRVIAHFEALLGGGPDPVTLARSTAGLVEAVRLASSCPTGGRHGSGRTASPCRAYPRRSPAGWIWSRPAVSGWNGPVCRGRSTSWSWSGWPSPPGCSCGRPWQPRVPTAADPALVELVLSGREDATDRIRALRLLGLAPDVPLRVVAVTGRPGTDAGLEAVALLGRGAVRGTVRVARAGALGAVLVQSPDAGGPGSRTASTTAELRAALHERGRERGTAHRPAHAVRVGVGASAAPLDARLSWEQARSALRFAVAGSPEESVADHGELGPVALLADIPVERLRAQEDVRRLTKLACGEGAGQGGDLLAALAAFCRTGSLRQAALELHLHHSSVAARLAHVEKELGLRLRDPQDRFGAQLALYAWRLTQSADGSMRQ